MSQDWIQVIPTPKELRANVVNRLTENLLRRLTEGMNDSIIWVQDESIANEVAGKFELAKYHVCIIRGVIDDDYGIKVSFPT
jgi:hypothetical protein